VLVLHQIEIPDTVIGREREIIESVRGFLLQNMSSRLLGRELSDDADTTRDAL
jgi:hypothetical protein